jgi:hypothetical protein
MTRWAAFLLAQARVDDLIEWAAPKMTFEPGQRPPCLIEMAGPPRLLRLHGVAV